VRYNLLRLATRASRQPFPRNCSSSCSPFGFIPAVPSAVTILPAQRRYERVRACFRSHPLPIPVVLLTTACLLRRNNVSARDYARIASSRGLARSLIVRRMKREGGRLSGLGLTLEKSRGAADPFSFSSSYTDVYRLIARAISAVLRISKFATRSSSSRVHSETFFRTFGDQGRERESVSKRRSGDENCRGCLS